MIGEFPQGFTSTSETEGACGKRKRVHREFIPGTTHIRCVSVRLELFFSPRSYLTLPYPTFTIPQVFYFGRSPSPSKTRRAGF